jgi:hypothetical protein
MALDVPTASEFERMAKKARDEAVAASQFPRWAKIGFWIFVGGEALLGIWMLPS